MSQYYTAFHKAPPISETDVVFHCGHSYLHGRPDLAIPVEIERIMGVPVIFWSRRPEDHRWRKGDSIQAALDAAPLRVERRHGIIRTWRDLWRS
jgi:hypothetical protein